MSATGGEVKRRSTKQLTFPIYEGNVSYFVQCVQILFTAAAGYDRVTFESFIAEDPTELDYTCAELYYICEPTLSEEAACGMDGKTTDVLYYIQLLIVETSPLESTPALRGSA